MSAARRRSSSMKPIGRGEGWGRRRGAEVQSPRSEVHPSSVAAPRPAKASLWGIMPIENSAGITGLRRVEGPRSKVVGLVADETEGTVTEAPMKGPGTECGQAHLNYRGIHRGPEILRGRTIDICIQPPENSEGYREAHGHEESDDQGGQKRGDE